MSEIINFITSSDFLTVVLKVVATALLSTCLGLVGTLIGKILTKNKESKIYKYAKTCVKAAEQKFPNDGKKMGPEKMAYVMDQLAIKFPKIKENTYLYNIAEAAVYELNNEDKQQAAIEEFERKYGEKPLAVQKEVVEESTDTETVVADDTVESEAVETDPHSVSNEEKVDSTKLTSF